MESGIFGSATECGEGMEVMIRLQPTGKGKVGQLVLLWVLSILWWIGIPMAQRSDAVPNVVVILTDDQRWDTLWAMPIVQDTLIRRGVHFTQAFVSTPLCCPYRASFLGGGYYAHNTGVLQNTLPNGGVQRFVDTNTLPLRLQQNGYATALVGKYLNGYPDVAPYIPPGWSRFVVPLGRSWTNFPVVIGASTDQPSTGRIEQKAQYVTDYLRDEALTFLDGLGNRPFFLYFAPSAPHHPATPAPGDEGLFSSYLYRSRGFGETDVSDKPRHIRLHHPVTPDEVAKRDEEHRNQLRSLQAVDRGVGALVDKLQELGKLDNTVIVFTSDNGLHWGEHGLGGKGYPYEESIRVPLIMVVPGVVPRKDDSLVVSNLDVPTTIWHLAGLPKKTDGLNLLPLLHDPHMPWRQRGIFIEYFPLTELTKQGGRRALPGIWAGWRTRKYKYVEHTTREKELYDLAVDPYELENVVTKAQYSAIVQRLAQRTAALKGLAISVRKLPPGEVGIPYYFLMKAWGGTLPYAWTIFEGTLPAGLTLDGISGVIQGIPVRSQKHDVLISVHDASIARQRREPQRFVQEYSIAIVEPGGLSQGEPVFSKERTAPLDADEEEEDDEDPNRSTFVSPATALESP